MTPEIRAWAIRNGVSPRALDELAAIFGANGNHTLPGNVKGVSESAVQSAVRLEASRKGVRLFRNNVGVMIDSRGVPVRYGLANDSQQMNNVVKSADLVGWRSLLITPEHVGYRVAQFVSRECKRVGWHYSDSEHERAQLAWAQLITYAGGDATFCTGEGTL